MRKSSRAHAVALGEPHQAALEADQALVDVVELLDERVDARLVEAERLHLGDDLVLELLVLALLRRRERLVLELVLDVLVLQAAQPLVAVGDRVEGLQHLRLELGLDRGERERALHVVVVAIGCALRLLLAVGVFLAVGAALNGVAGGRGRRRHRLRRRPPRPGIGCPAIGWPPGPPAPASPWRRGRRRSLRGR